MGLSWDLFPSFPPLERILYTAKLSGYKNRNSEG